jgi:hypothetical protein
VAGDLRRIEYGGWIMLEIAAGDEPLEGRFARAYARVPTLLA